MQEMPKKIHPNQVAVLHLPKIDHHCENRCLNTCLF